MGRQRDPAAACGMTKHLMGSLQSDPPLMPAEELKGEGWQESIGAKSTRAREVGQVSGIASGLQGSITHHCLRWGLGEGDVVGGGYTRGAERGPSFLPGGEALTIPCQGHILGPKSSTGRRNTCRQVHKDLAWGNP